MNANATQPLTALPGPAPAVQPGFLHALRGCWYLTWKSRLSPRQWPLLAATVLAIPLLAYFTTDEAHRIQYFQWLIVVHLQLTLPFYCLTVFGDLIREELQTNTLHFLTTRPVTRAQLFLGKFVSQMVWVQILAAVTGCCFVMAGLARGISGVGSVAALFLGAQFLAVLAFGALSALFGLLHKRYLVLGTIYGIVVEVGISQIPTNINSLAITRHLKTILANSAVLQEFFTWSSADTRFSVIALLVVTVIYVGVATVFFSFKEFHHSEDMQK